MNHAASLMERYSARVYHVAARSLLEAGSKHASPFTSGSPNRTLPFTRGGGASPPIVGTLDDRLVSRAKPRSSMRWPPDRVVERIIQTLVVIDGLRGPLRGRGPRELRREAAHAVRHT